MTIVKATYTRRAEGAKASIRYTEHRPGREGERMNRTLFGIDGAMGRWQAYHMIDTAAKESFFYRFVISPDQQHEDTKKDLYLREVTEKTMTSLEEQIQARIFWIAAEHNDHAPHRHIHIVAVVPERLNARDFQALRQTATAACLEQRKERDLQQEQSQERGEGRAWER
jgi:hypothetical protein